VDHAENGETGETAVKKALDVEYDLILTDSDGY
jgi:hypothetical protein